MRASEVYARHHATAEGFPTFVRCPLDGQWSRWRDTGASGVQYGCLTCSCIFRIPVAQARKPKVAAAIDKLNGLLRARGASR